MPIVMSRAIAIAAMLGCTASGSIAADAAFYVISNRVDANTVVGYRKDDSGSYAMFGEFKTGGTGTGDLEIPALEKDETHPLANGDDPLISANSLAASADRRHFVAVNPGNATLSLMKASDDLTLQSVNTVPASDKFPISVAIHDGLVVAASVGLDNGSGSISAFTIADGTLVPVADSRRDLAARPSTIAFSSDGEHVIVNELVTGKIKIFAVEDGSLSAEPVSKIDSPRAHEDRFQAIPVGFVVSGNGGDDVVLMSEARFLTPDFMLREGKGEVVQSPLYSWQTGSLSTYRLSDDGMIENISADVLTGASIEGGELANCWVALSPDGKGLWTANALSSSISYYRIGENGSAALVNDVAYKDESEELFFSDLSVSRDGTHLYQLVGNRGDVMIFGINDDGSLTLKQTVSGLPKVGAYGLLVH